MTLSSCGSSASVAKQAKAACQAYWKHSANIGGAANEAGSTTPIEDLVDTDRTDDDLAPTRDLLRSIENKMPREYKGDIRSISLGLDVQMGSGDLHPQAYKIQQAQGPRMQAHIDHLDQFLVSCRSKGAAAITPPLEPTTTELVWHDAVPLETTTTRPSTVHGRLAGTFTTTNGWGYRYTVTIEKPTVASENEGLPDQKTVYASFPLRISVRPTVGDRPSPAPSGFTIQAFIKAGSTDECTVFGERLSGTIGGQPVCQVFDLQVGQPSSTTETGTLPPGETMRLSDEESTSQTVDKQLSELMEQTYETPPDYWVFGFTTLIGAQGDGGTACRETLIHGPGLIAVFGRDGSAVPQDQWVDESRDCTFSWG